MSNKLRPVLRPVKKMKLHPYKRIGNLIPKGELTMVTGLPGTGKSFSVLKFLNQHNINPYYFNLDYDAEIVNALKAEFTDDKDLVKSLINGDVNDVQKDDVIIIDTYQTLRSLYKNNITDELSQIAFTDKCLKLVKNTGCTLIIIAHPEDYVGKSSILKDNPSLIRNCAEHLHFDKKLSTRKNVLPEYSMNICKGRGIGGHSTVNNWMRD